MRGQHGRWLVLNKVLVTGASRGIGRSVALELARLGFDLVLWARDGLELEEAAKECRQLNTSVTTAEVDVSDSRDVRMVGAQSLSDTTVLRGLVINAGIGIWGSVAAMERRDWLTVIDTNLGGAFDTLQIALPKLMAARGGQIVSMCSDSARFGFADRGAYCASKWGLYGLLEAVRAEVRPKGLRVTQLVPSRVDTFFRGKRPGMRPESLSSPDVAQVVGWVFSLPAKVEIRAIEMSAIASTFGP